MASGRRRPRRIQGSWLGRNSVTGLYGTRLLVLESANQFRPLPPPAVGSATFQAAFDDLYAVVANRTPEQIQSAYDWAGRNNAAMNEVATNLILAHHRTEREAARILARTWRASTSRMPASTPSSPYHYIRPSQFDPAITQLPGLGMPNHPSYPSGHSCIISAYATVLARGFPGERRELEAMVEARVSRMYAGFHYRFDLEAGQARPAWAATCSRTARPAQRHPARLSVVERSRVGIRAGYDARVVPVGAASRIISPPSPPM